MHGNSNYKNNYIELNGCRWNLTQLLVHEATHCLQFNALGLWKSNPIRKIPNWKNEWDITFEDGPSVSRQYYNYWLLIQYCMDIKKMTFRQILQDRMQEKALKQEMMTWYQLSTNRRDADFSVPNLSQESRLNLGSFEI